VQAVDLVVEPTTFPNKCLTKSNYRLTSGQIPEQTD
jgi:hypothetical protein